MSFYCLWICDGKFFLINRFFYGRYLVYIDENGDAAGNYTILAREKLREAGRENEYGLYPVGTFSAPDQEQIPV